MSYINDEPGFPLGIITAQSIAQPLTQKSLSSFHTSGNKDDEYNFSRIKDLIYNISNNKNTSCNIMLNKNISNNEIYCTFVYRELYNFINSINIFDSADYKKPWLKFSDKNKFSKLIEIKIKKDEQYKFMTLNRIKNIIYDKIKDRSEFDVFITISPEHKSRIIIFYNNNDVFNVTYNNIITFLNNIYICGIKNIEDIKINKKNNNINVITKGSNLRLILNCNIVNKKETISNNIQDVYETLGLEAAKNILTLELSNYIKKNHVKILVYCMTILGKILPINSNGSSKLDESFLSNISYEKSVKIIKNKIPFGVTEKIDNITKKLIIGDKPNIGTGIIKCLRSPVINIIYEDIFNCNKKNIKLSKGNNLIFLENIKINKIKSCVYSIPNERLLINEQLLTILKVSVDNNIKYTINNYLTLNMESKIYINHISYEILQGKNIYGIEINNNKFILDNSKSKLNIDNLNLEENTLITIIIKPFNIMNSIIKIVRNS